MKDKAVVLECSCYQWSHVFCRTNAAHSPLSLKNLVSEVPPAWKSRYPCRITEDSGLEGTHKDHEMQLLSE